MSSSKHNNSCLFHHLLTLLPKPEVKSFTSRSSSLDDQTRPLAVSQLSVFILRSKSCFFKVGIVTPEGLLKFIFKCMSSPSTAAQWRGVRNMLSSADTLTFFTDV